MIKQDHLEAQVHTFPRTCAMLLQELSPDFAEKKNLLSKFPKELLASIGKMNEGQYFSD